MSQIDDLRAEGDLCRNEGADDIARMLDKAAGTIEALAKMCKRTEYKDEYCPWCAVRWGNPHKPSCEWVTNGVDALLGEETE